MAGEKQHSDGRTDGQIFGQSVTDKIGFFGTAPVVQPTNASQAAITDNSGGAAAATTGVVANAFKQTLSIPVQLADLANAATWKYNVPFAFTLLALRFRTGKPASTASKLATLTAQVSGVAVTGGVAALTTANQNATGTALAASAITAGGTGGAAGGTVEAAVSSVTAFVEGDGYIEFDVVNVDLANTVATILAQTNRYRTDLVALGVIKGS